MRRGSPGARGRPLPAFGSRPRAGGPGVCPLL